MFAIRVQHDETTDRYHPAFYRLAPFPGPGPFRVERYKSGGHHTEGFATLGEAQASCVELARKLPVPVEVPEGGFEVRPVVVVGADILIVERVVA